MLSFATLVWNRVNCEVDFSGAARNAGVIMKDKRAALILGVSLLFAPKLVLAHHQFAATYDVKHPVLLRGTVIKIDWSNPHVHLSLDAMDERHEITRWEFEMASPNLLLMNGFKIDNPRPGDRVAVSAYPAKDGSSRGYASKVTLNRR
jgi:hypothetical protein